MYRQEEQQLEEASMTDKAKLYAVKNDEDKYLKYNPGIGVGPLWDDWGGIHKSFITDDEDDANAFADGYSGHVVELVEAPAKVVVSGDEAEMLERAKNMLNPMHVLWMTELPHNGDSDGQDRLMRAYVNGWVVEKPKRWNVKVPLVAHYIYRVDEGGLNIEPDSVGSLSAQFTSAEIEQYGLQDYEKVEVSDKGEQNE